MKCHSLVICRQIKYFINFPSIKSLFLDTRTVKILLSTSISCWWIGSGVQITETLFPVNLSVLFDVFLVLIFFCIHFLNGSQFTKALKRFDNWVQKNQRIACLSVPLNKGWTFSSQGLNWRKCLKKHHYHLPQLVSKDIKGPCPFFFKSSARRRRNAKAFYLTKTLCALVPLKYVILLICPLLCQLKSSSSSSVMRWHDVLSDDQFRNGAVRVSTTLRFLWSKTPSFDKL